MKGPNCETTEIFMALTLVVHRAIQGYGGYMRNHQSIKNYTATLVLVILLGPFGGHRFYVGKVGTGVLFLFTAGILGIGWVIDIFTVVFGNFTDKTGRFIRPKKRIETGEQSD